MARLPRLLYKYVGADGAKDVLVHRRLQFTAGTCLNDSLELIPDRFVPPPADQVRERLREVLLRALNEPLAPSGPPTMVEYLQQKVSQGMSPLAAVEHTVDLLVDPTKVQRQVFEPIHAMLSQARVCSMTTVPDCPLMWSAYGQKCSGVVIGFEPILSTPQGQSRPVQISYSSSSSDLRAVDLDRWVAFLIDPASHDPEAALHRAMYTKPTAYQSEHEWRHCCRTNDANDIIKIPIRPTDIREVIFGERTSAPQMTELIDLVTQLNHSVTIRQVRASVDTPDRLLTVEVSRRTSDL